MNWPEGLVAVVPPAVVTVTFTVPTPAGDVAFNCVPFTKVTDVLALVPNFTVEALVKLVPVMVTLVPPDAGPTIGLINVTVGAFRYVY